MDFLTRLQDWVAIRFPDGLPHTSQALYELVLKHNGEKAYIDTFVMMLRNETDIDLATDPEWLATTSRFAPNADRFAARRAATNQAPATAPAYVETIEQYLSKNRGASPSQWMPKQWEYFVTHPSDYFAFKAVATEWHMLGGEDDLLLAISGLPPEWRHIRLNEVRELRTPSQSLPEGQELARYGQWLLNQSTDPNSLQAQIHLLRTQGAAFAQRADQLEADLLAEEQDLLDASPGSEKDADPGLTKLFALTEYYHLLYSDHFERENIRKALGEDLIRLAELLTGKIYPDEDAAIWERAAQEELGFSLATLPEQESVDANVRIGRFFLQFLEQGDQRELALLKLFLKAASGQVPVGFTQVIQDRLNTNFTELLAQVRTNFAAVRAFAEQVEPSLRGTSPDELLAFLETALQSYYKYLQENDLENFAYDTERHVEQLQGNLNFAGTFETEPSTAPATNPQSNVLTFTPTQAPKPVRQFAAPSDALFPQELGELFVSFRVAYQPAWEVTGRYWIEQQLGNTLVRIGYGNRATLRYIDPEGLYRSFWNYIQQRGPTTWRSFSLEELRKQLETPQAKTAIREATSAYLEGTGVAEFAPDFFNTVLSALSQEGNETEPHQTPSPVAPSAAPGEGQTFSPDADELDRQAEDARNAGQNPPAIDLTKTPLKTPDGEGYATLDPEILNPKPTSNNAEEFKVPELPGYEATDDVAELIQNGMLTHRGLAQLQNVLAQKSAQYQTLRLPNAQGAVAVVAGAQAANEAAAASAAIARLAKAFEVFFVLAK